MFLYQLWNNISSLFKLNVASKNVFSPHVAYKGAYSCEYENVAVENSHLSLSYVIPLHKDTQTRRKWELTGGKISHTACCSLATANNYLYKLRFYTKFSKWTDYSESPLSMTESVAFSRAAGDWKYCSQLSYKTCFCLVKSLLKHWAPQKQS